MLNSQLGSKTKINLAYIIEKYKAHQNPTALYYICEEFTNIRTQLNI